MQLPKLQKSCAHLQAGDDGEAAHKFGDEAVLDQVGLLHLFQHIGRHLGLPEALNFGPAERQATYLQKAVRLIKKKCQKMVVERLPFHVEMPGKTYEHSARLSDLTISNDIGEGREMAPT